MDPIAGNSEAFARELGAREIALLLPI
jgi:hypothetical protein